MSRSFPRTARLFKMIALGSVLVVGQFAGAAVAADYFLKLGDIKGESADKGHKGEIEVQSWSWGATNPGSAKVSVSDLSFTGKRDSASGQPSGRVSKVDSFTVKQSAAPPDPAGDGGAKKIDKSTPKLAEARGAGSVTVSGRLPGCSVGTLYADALLGGPNARFELRDVVITACADASVSLDYASIRELPQQTSAK
ncbi:MAG TPA: type VI secretion system tube protein Hcp [Sphingomicrobium sp.]|nr:type VI secretion system tube protein Hcp [Sphingomicrobium sp.]